MTPASRLGQMVRQHRWSNHAATLLITLCAGGIVALLIMDQTTTPNRPAQPTAALHRFPPKRQAITATGPMAIFREQQDTESAAWSSIFNWMTKNRVSSGHCTLKPDASVFHMQCISSEGTDAPNGTKSWQALDLEPALFKPVREMNKGSSREPEQGFNGASHENLQNDDSVRQRGWVVTQQGLRHYDVKKQAWLAPGHRP